jgi:hypothetical protein
MAAEGRVVIDETGYDWDGAPVLEPPDYAGPQRNGTLVGKDGQHTWQAADLTDVLDGTWKPVGATVGSRNDGVGLFYRGKQHTVASESEGGKSWFLLTAALDEIDGDNHVAYLDFEDDRGPVVGRLLSLGANPGRIQQYFHYIRPESPITIPVNQADLDGIMAEYSPTLAVIDGVTEAMVMHGLDPLDNKDAATFGRLIPRRLSQ